MSSGIKKAASSVTLSDQALIARAVRCLGKKEGEIRSLYREGEYLYFDVGGDAYRLISYSSPTDGETMMVDRSYWAISGGCSGEKKTLKWEPDRYCTVAETPPEKLVDETIYTDGVNTVVMTDKLDKRYADFFLDRTQKCKEAVLDLFGVRTPSEHLTVFLRNDDLPVHTGGWGSIHANLSNVKIASMNRDAEQVTGPLENASAPCDVNYLGTFVHEMCHAVTVPAFNPWWGAAEGLAEYTAHSITTDKLGGSTEFSVRERSSALAQRRLSLQERWLPECDGMSTVNSIQALAISPDSLTYRVELAHSNEYYDQTVSLNACRTVFSAKLCFMGITDGAADLSIYDQKGVFWGDKFCGGHALLQPQFIKTADRGTLNVEGGEIGEPYATLQSDERDRNHHEYYETAFCFWDNIKNRYGAEAVKNIVRSMMEFSQAHQDSLNPFPFFKTFMDITGTSAAEAAAFFNIYSTSMDDEQYLMGGICWPSTR